MIRVFDDLESLSAAAAELFALRANEAVAHLGRFSVALSGGSTPRRCYELLAEEPLKSHVPWEHVHAFWGDERYVPPTDDASNERMARAALLDKVPIPASQVHPMYAPGGPDKAAEAYEILLREHFGHEEAGFDLAFTGIGADGHTGSLFPVVFAKAAGDPRWVLPTTSPIGAAERITLNAPLLTTAHTLLFMAAGQDKAATLAVVFGDRSDLPVAQIARHAAHAVWMVDAAAASQLPASLRR